MQVITIALLLVVATVTYAGKPHYNLNDAPYLFEEFIKKYGRHYKDKADKCEHYKAFAKSLKVINEANSKPSTATFDINNFADYTPEEQKNLFGSGGPPRDPR